MQELLVLTLVLFFVFIDGLEKVEEAVRITGLEVPSYLFEGEDARLSCSFEASHKIYSIKWYRDDKEFFHFIPSQRPNKMVQPMPGIHVNMHGSNGLVVFLDSVTLEAEGRFKCEVSTEWPQYFTADKSSRMDVIVMTGSNPKIYKTQDSYHLGAEVSFICISPLSKKPLFINWFINNKKAPASMVRHSIVGRGVNEIEQHRASLMLNLDRNLFKNGSVTLKCLIYLPPSQRGQRGEAPYDQITFNIPVPTPSFRRIRDRTAISRDVTDSESIWISGDYL